MDKKKFMESMADKKARLVFDNGGGLVLKLDDKWAHYYFGDRDSLEQAADDLIAYADGDNLDDFDGHDDAAMDTGEDWCKAYWAEDMVDDDEDTGWANVNDFREILEEKLG